MKFKILIKSNSWLSVEATLLKLYPDEKKNILGYEEVFNKLLFTNAEKQDMSIVVAKKKDDFDGEEYVDVSGKYNNPKNEEEGFLHAIDFTAWSKWLGMDIYEESSQNFSELEIIAYCLFEMTFIAFEEEEIQEELNKLDQQVEEIKNMTEEEKREKFTSWEDFMKELENEEDDDEENDKLRINKKSDCEKFPIKMKRTGILNF